MPFKANSPDLVILYALGTACVVLLLYILAIKIGALRERRHIAAICEAIVDYFRKSGVDVAADCVRVPGKNSYTGFIESEPMKRFRLSHIIEITLSEHVRRTCDLDLERVFWRFPVKEEVQAEAAQGMAGQAAQTAQAAPAAGSTSAAPVTAGAAEDGKPAPGTDEYINEGLEHHKYLPKVEVTETSWEQFKEVATTTPEQK